MKFYFCGRYINTDAEDKEVERDMYATIHTFGVLMIMMGVKSEKSSRGFFSYFSLTPKQKCHNALMKLAGVIYRCCGRTTKATVDIDLSDKIFFMLGMLHTSRSHNSVI